MLVISSAPAYNKGQQTDTTFCVRTGSVTHYSSEMSKYAKKKRSVNVVNLLKSSVTNDIKNKQKNLKG